MENLFLLLTIVSMGGIGYGFFQGLTNKLIKNKKVKKEAKKIILASSAAFIIGIIGFGINMPPSESLTDDTNEQISAESTSESDELDTLEQQKIEQERFDSELQDLRATLPALAYDEVQTIELNDNTPLFGPLDLTLENGSWETYGELDKLNRATSAEAMLNQDLMPTEKRGDISNVEPTGWKNKKLGKSYLYNRTHLIGFALSGENDNWKNLITGTTQLNNPEMLRHEMDIKYYLEQDKNNYVRYSVTPIFKDNELLARGVHLMAQSVNDDTIRFNVYIFNIQDGVELNYADGSSLTEEEIAEKDRIAAQNEDQDRIAAEEASVQAEPVEATIQSQETQYVDANGQGTIKGSNSGIYHLPGSTYYHKTTNVAQWFKTISDAENAGYRAPKR